MCPAPIDNVEALLAHAAGEMGLVAMGIVRDGSLEHPTAALRACLAWPEGEASMPVAGVVAEVDLAHFQHAMQVASRTPVSLTCRARRCDGTEFDAEVVCARIDPSRAADAVAVVWTDVSARRKAETHLRHMAFFDPLTGLANRALLADRLRQALLHARRSGVGFAVLATDLDGFKAANDLHGHDVGDELLREVARRLREVVRESDTVARAGGDEFTLVLPAARNVASAAIVAGRAIRAIDAPFTVGDAQIRLGLTVGIATWPHHASEPEALLAAADAALYEGKRAGRNRYRVAHESEPPSRAHASVWRESLVLGVGAIDRQHRTLAALIDQIDDDLQRGHDRDRLLATFEALVTHAKEHFDEEEELMEHSGFPGRHGHANEHRRLLDDLRSLSVAIDEQSMALTRRYLHDWFVRHVDGMDRAFARSLLAKSPG